MSARGLVAVCWGEPAPEAASALGEITERTVAVAPGADPSEVERLAAAKPVLWLPASARIEPPLAAAIGAWLEDAAASPRVAFARCGLEAGPVEVPLPRVLLLSTPGALRIVAGEPQPCRGVASSTLPVRLRWCAPASLSAHLMAINAETNLRARRLNDAGALPSWTGLTLRPLLVLAPAVLCARGPRRLALPRAVLEAYREVLLTAKLWELRHVSPLGR
jgi:hypothetical protein